MLADRAGDEVVEHDDLVAPVEQRARRGASRGTRRRR